MKSMWQQNRKLLGLVLVLAMMLPYRAALADRACRTYQAVVEGQYTTISREGNQIVLESEQSVLSGSYIIDGDGNYVLHGADRSYQAVWDNDKLLLEGYVVLEPGRDHSFQGIHSYYGMNLEKYYLEMDAGTQTFEMRIVSCWEVAFQEINLMGQKVKLIDSQGRGLMLMCNGESVVASYEYRHMGTYEIVEEYGEYVVKVQMDDGRKLYGTISGITLKVAGETYLKVDEGCYSDGTDFLWLLNGQLLVAGEFEASIKTFVLTANEITLETDEGIVQLREEDDQLYLTIDENTYTFIRTDE